MKPLTTFFAVFIALGAISMFAQNEAKDQTDKAMQPAQTRLPEDQPKAATSPSAAATSPSTPASAGQSNQAEMMRQMMEMSKLNENHKLLASLAGTWNYTIRFWMTPDPNAPPQESKGTATTKSMMDGRYFVTDVTGTMKMPGPDGKTRNMQFKGMGVDGYDNVKNKFVASWIDNMGTGIVFSEGTYDPATKSFTYTSEVEPVPGMKSQVREVIRISDKDHRTFEWYENRGGQEVKTMEIAYTRKR
ncbi:MAG TPA: DUF1579 domain-containing protein [Chthoniobacterales bacterium]|nr:DUF1579 domain-containing protein [Chthoniobacterales bacterium]